MGKLIRILGGPKKSKHAEMFSKITPLDACDLVEDILRMDVAQSMIEQLSTRTDRQRETLNQIRTMRRALHARLRDTFLST